MIILFLSLEQLIVMTRSSRVMKRQSEPDKFHTGKFIRRFGGIYAYCRYFIDRKW